LSVRFGYGDLPLCASDAIHRQLVRWVGYRVLCLTAHGQKRLVAKGLLAQGQRNTFPIAFRGAAKTYFLRRACSLRIRAHYPTVSGARARIPDIRFGGAAKTCRFVVRVLRANKAPRAPASGWIHEHAIAMHDYSHIADVLEAYERLGTWMPCGGCDHTLVALTGRGGGGSSGCGRSSTNLLGVSPAGVASLRRRMRGGPECRMRFHQLSALMAWRVTLRTSSGGNPPNSSVLAE